MAEALVTPHILTWARQRRGLGIDDLAAKLHVKPEAVSAWEAGEKRPTFRQAQNFAHAAYIPFGYLYLADPPVEELPLTDFRTIPGQPPREPSPDFLDLLHDVLGKQEWFREYRQAEGVEELPFVGRFATTDPEEEVARDIRDVIDVDGAREKASNWEGFMRQLTLNAERAGIMVLRSGVVGNNNHRPLDVEEFRGFSVSDHVAPLIFINGRDFKGAQIFTLGHEMAHVWSGQGGVSNPDYGFLQEQQDTAVEQFCNRVAAETLVPGTDFQARWKSNSTNLETSLKMLSRHYKVSPLVILRQAFDHDFLSAESYRDSYRQLIEQASQREPAGESGGNFYYTLLARNGTEFTSAVLSSLAEGATLYREAGALLNVKVSTLPQIAQQVHGDAITLG